MKVAIVHYWLINWRGGEQVLKAIADLFPEADIFTHVADRRLLEKEFPGRNISTTFIARMPLANRFYRRYLPFMPLALEQLDLRCYDLILSSEAGPAKGIIPPPHAVHICYCHSPMRYIWDRYYDYRSQAGPLTRLLMAPSANYLRLWDQVSAQRVDHYIANSHFVAQRIAKYYRRSAEVIYPPVAVERFDASHRSQDFYLWVGQLVSYKRPDLLIDAFNLLQKPLIVIGGGELLPRLRRKAKPNVKLLGSQPFEVIRDHYARCRALVFPGVEDFGMVPVEAMASGKPVIAYELGGQCESVVDGITGVFFKQQSSAAIIEAVQRFEAIEAQFDSHTIRAHAMKFSLEAFRRGFSSYLSRIVPPVSGMHG